MILSSARRFALVLAVGATTLAFHGTAHADSVTGTDPVPKCGCGGHSVTTPAPSTATAGASVGVLSAILLVLGLS